MGNKNRIFLAVLTNEILHILRNTFKNKEIYITKAKFSKIQIKHQDISHYLNNTNFQNIIDNTIGICGYKQDEELINFVSIIDNSIIIYSLSISTQNYYTHIGTIFKSDKRKTLKQCSHNIKFLSASKEKIFNEFI